MSFSFDRFEISPAHMDHLIIDRNGKIFSGKEEDPLPPGSAGIGQSVEILLIIIQGIAEDEGYFCYGNER